MIKYFYIFTAFTAFSFSSTNTIPNNILNLSKSECINFFSKKTSNYILNFSEKNNLKNNFNISSYNHNIINYLLFKELSTDENKYSDLKINKLNKLLNSNEMKILCSDKIIDKEKITSISKERRELLNKLIELLPYTYFKNSSLLKRYLIKNELIFNKVHLSNYTNDYYSNLLIELELKFKAMSDEKLNKYIDFLEKNKDTLIIFNNLILLGV